MAKLTKFVTVLFMCGVVRHVTSVPLKEVQHEHARVKRTPADNFTLFGFGIKPPVLNPILRVQEAIGNLFIPAHIPLQNENINKNYDIKPIGTNIQHQSVEIQNDNDKEAKAVIQNANNNTNIEPTKNVPDHNLKLRENNSVEKKQPPNTENASKETIQNKHPKNVTIEVTQNEHAGNATKENPEDSQSDVDQNILDYIFQSNDDTYTTVTGDYENTTDVSDELLRIPAPVVASLLG